MKFDQYLEFRLFVRRKLPLVTDEALAARLEGSVFPEVSDDVFFILDDAASSYFGEVKLHSGKKPFYQKLMADSYTFEHLPALCSLTTHFAISLSNRLSSRSDVDVSAFVRVRERVDGLITAILQDGSCGSETLRPFL